MPYANKRAEEENVQTALFEYGDYSSLPPPSKDDKGKQQAMPDLSHLQEVGDGDIQAGIVSSLKTENIEEVTTDSTRESKHRRWSHSLVISNPWEWER